MNQPQSGTPSLFQKFSLLLLFLLLAAPGFADSSVFEQRAFVGRFRIALSDSNNQPIKNWGGDSVFFAQVSDAEGVALINSLGDSTFNATNCPASSEKREYYVSYQSTGVATHVGCTNGTSFLVRIRVGPEQGGIRPGELGDTGAVRFTQIDAGPPATATGTGSSNNTPNFKVVLTYQGEGPGAPFARVPPDYLLPFGSTPAAGTSLVPGSTLNMNLNVRYRLTSAVRGTLQGTLLSNDQVLATTTPALTSLQFGENTTSFSFPSVTVPSSGVLTLRGELRSSATGPVVASYALNYPVYQAPKLTMAPAQLRWNSPAGAKAFDDSIVVTNPSAQPVAYTATLANGSKWLTLGAASGNIATSVSLPLKVDPTGLAPGYYFDTVLIATSLGNLNVPVAVRIGSQPTSLNVEPNGLRFDVRQGQGSPTSQTLSLYHSGPEGTSTNWSARVITGASLVQLSATSGTATAGNPSALAVSLASTATDSMGDAYAVIEVSSPSSAPEYVTVVANVTATSNTAPPILNPVSLVFIAPQGGAPVTQRVQVHMSERNPTNFTTTFSGGGDNFSTNIVAGSASTTSPGLVDVIFTPGSLGTGQATTLFNVSTSTQLKTTRILRIVLPPAGTACTATGVRVRETSIVERFMIPAGWPQPITAQLYDNCGNRVKTGTITASFSNGDPSVRLNLDEATGEFFATWTPQIALNTGIKVSLQPSVGALFGGVLEINGTVTGNQAFPPRLISGGILNNLNPVVGAPLAPGTIAQIYGDYFYEGPGFESAPAPPLSGRFKGAQLLISGIPAPFFYISKTQAAVQIPTELTPGLAHSAVLEVNGVYSAPLSFEVEGTTPGVVSASGAIVAQHAATYALVSPQSPAKPGESLILYLVGMGATSPSVATGAAAPASPLAQAVEQPVVTIGGKAASVPFAGLTPGFAGLYQINLVVPETAADGDLDVVITQNGVAANATKLAVKK